MRILLDVNVLVRANERSRGPARLLLLTLIEEGHTLITSSEILMELVRVLRYPRLQELYALTEKDIYRYLQFLQAVSEIVLVDHFLRVPIRDSNDVAVLQAAIAGETDIICSVDRDFTEPPAGPFCAAAGIEVWTDVELLRRIRTWRS